MDAPRLLAKHAGHVEGPGYTTNPLAAIPGEPEAIPRDTQERITLAAHRNIRERQLDELRLRRAALEREINWYYSQRFDRDVSGPLRIIRRQLDRIERRLAQ